MDESTTDQFSQIGLEKFSFTKDSWKLKKMNAIFLFRLLIIEMNFVFGSILLLFFVPTIWKM